MYSYKCFILGLTYFLIISFQKFLWKVLRSSLVETLHRQFYKIIRKINFLIKVSFFDLSWVHGLLSSYLLIGVSPYSVSSVLLDDITVHCDADVKSLYNSLFDSNFSNTNHT